MPCVFSLATAARCAVLLIGVLCRTSGAGAQIRIEVPRIGYIFDSAQKCVRAVEGLPGAAVLGGPIPLGTGEFQATLSPRNDYAILVLPATGNVVVADLQDRRKRIVPAESVPPGPDRIVVSPSGDAAALLYRAESRLFVIAGLPFASSVAELRLTHVGDLLAVSDDGQVLLADGQHVILHAAAADARIVSIPSEALGAAFLPHTRNAVVATTSGELWGVEADSARLLHTAAKVTGRDGLVFSGDGKRLFAALDGRSAIRIYDAGGFVDVEAGGAVTALFRMNGNAVFRIGDESSRTVRLLDADRRQPRIVVVPPGDSSQP